MMMMIMMTTGRGGWRRSRKSEERHHGLFVIHQMQSLEQGNITIDKVGTNWRYGVDMI